jgi:signal transduction histidine kinase
MASPPEHADRDRTDRSLANERAKSDASLAARTAAERAADVVTDRARDETDEAVSDSRAKSDAKLAESAIPAAQVLAAVEQGRVTEDKLVRDERADADERLMQQRVTNARLLATFIVAERGKTDGHLRDERSVADSALTNRDDFLGMVTHDLRDLLGGIAVNAKLITKLTASDQQGTEVRLSAERIERSAGRMARLVSDLVDTASIGAGSLRVTPTSGDAARVVAEALELWRGHASTHQVALEARSSRSVEAKIDHDRILQVLGNLITNAVKFSPTGATVVVGFDVVGTNVRFFVEDRGPGIPSDKLAAVFDRFWQERKDDGRGLGLGLYIARCLVEAHGGRIWVESEVGLGSSFFFTVPCV